MEKQTVKHPPKYPVNMHYVNHGKVFGNENWYTYYCGYCHGNVYGSAKICEHCGAIFKDKVAYEESKDSEPDKATLASS